MNILFIVPSKDTPSAIVRVFSFYPLLDKIDIPYHTIEYYDELYNLFRRSARIPKFFRKRLHGLTKCIWRPRQLRRIVPAALRSDIVFVQWVLPPVWVTLILRFCCKRIVYDFDDALFVRDFSRWSYLVRHSWRVIAGSRYGLEKAAALNPHSIQIPSSVSHAFAEFDHERELVEKDSKCICIGWLGGRGTRRYLKHVIEPLHRLSEANLPFELLIAGVDRTDDITNWFKGMKITQIPLYNHEDIPRILARIDIGIMPLDQTEWELGKCAMKTILYMAAGIATVSSDYGEVQYVVNDGFNGLLASTVEDWTEKMRLLIENPGLRSTLGQAGRRTVEQYYTSKTAFGLLTEHVFKVGIGNNPPLTYNHSSG